MTTWGDEKLKCPVCKRRFVSQVLMSFNTSGRHTTDFRECSSRTLPLHFFVHTCPECGYTGDEDVFKGVTSVDKSIREFVRKELTPRVRQKGFHPGRKYGLLALFYQHAGVEIAIVGETYLNAAWRCSDINEKEDEIEYRRKAIECLEKALKDNTANKSGICRCTCTYLVGELYRRVGDLESAGKWFDKVGDVVGDDKEKEWLVELARQQKTAPKEYLE